jgi:hypothetical protein
VRSGIQQWSNLILKNISEGFAQAAQAQLSHSGSSPGNKTMPSFPDERHIAEQL